MLLRGGIAVGVGGFGLKVASVVVAGGGFGALGVIGTIGVLGAGLGLAAGGVIVVVGVVMLGQYALSSNPGDPSEANEAADMILDLSSPFGMGGAVIGGLTGGPDGVKTGIKYGDYAQTLFDVTTPFADKKVLDAIGKGIFTSNEVKKAGIESAVELGGDVADKGIDKSLETEKSK